MLRLREFDLRMPESLDEACSILAKSDDAVVVAGGTDLIPKMKRGQFEPGVVVSLANVKELDYCHAENGALAIGSRVRLCDLETWVPLRGFTCVLEAVRQVATPIIRNMATVGGNLLQDTRCRYYDRGHFWRDAVGYCLKKGDEDCRVAPGGSRCFASLCSDLAPAFIAVGAEVTLAGAQHRTVPLEQLYVGDGLTPVHLERSILKEVRVPASTFASTYRKLRMRGGFDFPEVGLAVSLQKQSGGLQVNVAISGVSSGVVTIRESIGWDGLDDFVNRVHATIKPMDTLFFPPAYRKNVTRNLLRQALDDLLAS
jgi:4-hydroxybenzoyl-CoA reductase subunit beta